ncbi:MAG: DEAD/DEAH box helicase [Acidimicrobiales bacterium]
MVLTATAVDEEPIDPDDEGPGPLSAGVAVLTFVPGDPPRAGRFALFLPPGATPFPTGSQPFFDSVLEVLWPAGSTVRRTRVAAGFLSVAEGLSYLTGSPPRGAPAPTTETALPWAAAAAGGLGLLSRGRLFPSVSPAGFDAWRAGPLDPADHRLLEEIAAAMPPAAHCLACGGGSPARVMSPPHLVRAVWDAIADAMVRSPAAGVVAAGLGPGDGAAAGRSPGPLFAVAEPQPAGDLADWLHETGRGLEGGVQVGLRIVLGGVGAEDDALLGDPEGEMGDAGDGAGGGSAATAVVQVASAADPSLIVDAADLLRLPPVVLARMGDDPDLALLLALRRGARAWPTMTALLAQRIPSSLPLTDDDLEELLTGSGADALAAAGIEVLWPADLLVDGLTLRASFASPPKVAGTSGFTLSELVTFRWQATIGEEELSDDELEQLAEAKRSIVRLRGRWVAVDPAVLARARDRRERSMSGGEALAALLAGELAVDGETVPVVASGTIASFVEQLRSLGDGGVPVLGPPPGLSGELRPYQRRGVTWLQSMCELGLGGCLADDMGLGKTVQVIGLHLHRREALGHRKDAGRRRRKDPVPSTTLIACPTSLLGNWVRELQRFAPGVPVRRYYGNERTLESLAPGEVVVTTYGVARRDREVLRDARFSLVVADEAQHAKNPHSETARTLRVVGGQPGQVRVALTGTPVENRLSELWSILDWTTPGLLGPLERFQKTVAGPIERRRDPQVTERLSRTVRPFLLRRKKTDPAVAPDLPPRTVTDLPVGLTPEQVTLYEAEVREAMAAIEKKSGIQRQGLIFRMLTVLKQICNHPAHYLHQPGPLAGRSAKLAALEELLPVILAEGDSVLVFSQYVEMCALIEARLSELGIPSLFLHGSLPVRRREELVAAFQAGRVPVFLLSLKAGGVGLNLTRATHVVHYDRWWNPAVEDQATDRAHRIGQDRPVQVHRLVAEGTLEDRIAQLLESKRELAESVVGEGEAWIARMSDAELADLVRLGAPDGEPGRGGARRARGAGETASSTPARAGRTRGRRR